MACRAAPDEADERRDCGIEGAAATSRRAGVGAGGAVYFTGTGGDRRRELDVQGGVIRRRDGPGGLGPGGAVSGGPAPEARPARATAAAGRRRRRRAAVPRRQVAAPPRAVVGFHHVRGRPAAAGHLRHRRGGRASVRLGRARPVWPASAAQFQQGTVPNQRAVPTSTRRPEQSGGRRRGLGRRQALHVHGRQLESAERPVVGVRHAARGPRPQAAHRDRRVPRRGGGRARVRPLCAGHAGAPGHHQLPRRRLRRGHAVVLGALRGGHADVAVPGTVACTPKPAVTRPHLSRDWGG
mmetsp:Transcript_5574/g.14148  ORF Transcript_5574/g.14148 Transcript_5574/m.14148 type:complete len:296 (+) Transcript_5574:1-888(+)